MKARIYEEIRQILGRDFVLESPKDRALAHFATPLAFILAKEQKRSPLDIAQDLAAKFVDNPHFEKVEAIKGYVNFRLSGEFLNEIATNALKEPQNFAKGAPKKEKFLLEFVSANPTGPLHIGHARGAIFGDSLTRVARHLGYAFDTEYYINDAGKQIRMLGLSVLCAVKELEFGEKFTPTGDIYKGDYIKDLAKEALSEFGADFFAEQKNFNAEDFLAKQNGKNFNIDDFLAQQNSENIDKIASWAKDKMLILIKANLAKAGIFIDKYVSEQSFYPKFDATIAALRENGGIYESEGKIWLKSSAKGDDKDRVIVNERGERSYLAADIVYHGDKMSRGYDKCINIWGADHHGYIPRVKAALEFLGFSGDKLEVILAQMVSLLSGGKPYKMSKRAGNFILMDEVLDEIGADALRYIFISKKCDTQLEFDIEALKKQDSSNPVFYINYAHARVHQVFKKAACEFKDAANADLSGLGEDALNLLFEALNLGAVAQNAFEERALQKIADYLKALAASFHKFYNENRVIGSANEKALLKLFAIVALSIKTGFAMIGIEAKERMDN